MGRSSNSKETDSPLVMLMIPNPSLRIVDNPMQEQKVLMDEAFEKWRGDLEQIDDVCIIGVKA